MTATEIPEVSVSESAGARYDSAILIDDNRLELMLNRSLLQRNHFAQHLLAFMNPQNALEFLNDAAGKHIYDDSDKPIVIFLDLYMPEMTGFEFLDAFEQLDESFKSKFKIYLLSNCTNPVELMKVKGCKSIYGFIPKPLSGRLLAA